jgi:hypothetical protein
VSDGRSADAGRSGGTASGRRDALRELSGCVASLRRNLERLARRRSDTERRRPDRHAPEIAGRLLAAAARFVEDVDVLHLYDELRRRFPFSPTGDRSGEIDEFGFDADRVEELRPLLDFLCEHWWSVRLEGVARIPDEDRVLFAIDDGEVPPWPALVIAHAIERHHPSRRRPRFLVGSSYATLPFAAPELTRLGGVSACPENAERLLSRGHWVVAPARVHASPRSSCGEERELVALAARTAATVVPVKVRADPSARPLGRPAPWRVRFGAPLERVPRTGVRAP